MKIVDYRTGDVQVIRDTFIDEHTTDSSVRFNRLANLLGLDKYARLNKDLSYKLTFLYNKVAKIVGDDPHKVANALEVFKKNTRANNLNGREMIDSIYRIMRLESDREDSLQKLKAKLEEEQKKSEDFSNSFVQDLEAPTIIQAEAASKERLDGTRQRTSTADGA